MLESLPEETTQLLIDLCTTTGPLVPDESQELTISPSKPSAPAPSYLSYLALNRGATAMTSVSSETATPPSPSIKTVRADNASTRKGSVHEASSPSTPPPTTSSIITSRAAPPSATIPPPPPPAKRLSPRVYFPHFADHMEQFVVFLETVALRRWEQTVEDQAPGSIGLYSTQNSEFDMTEDDEVRDKQDQVAVWNTLLELYLTLPTRGRPGENGKKFDEGVMKDKAMRILRSSSIPYDPMHALILCSTYGFTDGMVLIWEKMGMYEDVLRFWMDRYKEGNSPKASQRVIDQLMYYGKDHPSLYPLVLRFLTSTPELLDKHQEDLKGILEYIDEEELIPPLGVIQVLSRNGVASVGLVKEWLVKRITQSRSEIMNVRTKLFFVGYLLILLFLDVL